MFWININYLLTGPKGNKTNSFRRDQSLSYLLYSSRRKLFRVQIYKNKSRERSTLAGNSALLPADIIDYWHHRFSRETVWLLDVMWLRSNQWEHSLLRPNFQLYNNTGYFPRWDTVQIRNFCLVNWIVL